MDELDDIELEEENDEVPEIEEVVLEDASTEELPASRKRTGAERLCKPVMGKLARARIIAARAGQLQLGAPSVIPSERLQSNKPEEIAKQEFEERVLPLKIIRRYPDNTYDEWTLSDFKYFGPGRSCPRPPRRRLQR